VKLCSCKVGESREVFWPEKSLAGSGYFVEVATTFLARRPRIGRNTVTLVSVARASIKEVLGATFGNRPHAAAFRKYYAGLRCCRQCLQVRTLLLNSKSTFFPKAWQIPPALSARNLMDTIGSEGVGYFPQLEKISSHNHDGVGGMHMHLPWWKFDRKNDFLWGYGCHDDHRVPCLLLRGREFGQSARRVA
jgi:hypothetical protein